MKFSVIVPVYNVEKYIDKCLDSLVSQDFSDYEIIVIDDKSTDSSLELARKWEKNYSNIRVFSKENNSGLSETRNYGLQKAAGEYVIFVDSDDYVEQNCLSELKTEIDNYNSPDVLYFPIYVQKEGGIVRLDMYNSQNKTCVRSKKFMLNELKHCQLYVAVWSAIYKRKLIVDNHILFKSGLLHEDELWSPQIMYKAKRVVHSDFAFYYYVKRENSISTAKDRTQNGLDIISTCHELIRISANYNEKQLKKWMRNHIAMLYMKATTMGRLYRKEYRYTIIRSFPLRNVCTFKNYLKALLFLVSPILYCKVNGVVKR